MGDVPGADTFDLVNLLYDHDLCTQLAAWRDEGLSLESIIARIEDEKGYRPGRESVRRWIAKRCQ